MKIIILGAGQVGSTVAENLVSEANDITIIDQQPAALANLKERLDIHTVVGNAAHPGVLEAAGANDADMVLAVTSSDEVNMLACQIAYSLFHTPTKIARVRAEAYLERPQLFSQDVLPIDKIISPEHRVTESIQRLIAFPGALQVLDFADGKVQLVAVKAYSDGPLIGHALRTLREHIPKAEPRVAAVYRSGRAIIPEGDTVIQPGDEVFFVAAPNHIRAMMGELGKLDNPVKRVILAGGGHIGKRLALALEGTCQVKIIEYSAERAAEISEQLRHSIVLLGDAADEDLLLDENIEDTDIFCALTNDDEVNIISSMLAKRLGAKKVLALINRAAYVDLVQSDIIDIAISPQQSTISSLLADIRRGDVVVAHSLRRGAAEAIEAVAHGDVSSSAVVGRRIDEIDLPPSASIDAIVRGHEVIIAHHDTVIEADDHVIAFVADKRRVKDLERLFQVGVTFL